MPIETLPLYMMIVNSIVAIFPFLFIIFIYFDVRRFEKRGVQISPWTTIIGFAAFILMLRNLSVFFIVFLPVTLTITSIIVNVVLPIGVYIFFRNDRLVKAVLATSTMGSMSGIVSSSPSDWSKKFAKFAITYFAIRVLVRFYAITQASGSLAAVFWDMIPVLVSVGIAYFLFRDASKLRARGVLMNPYIASVGFLLVPSILISIPNFKSLPYVNVIIDIIPMISVLGVYGWLIGYYWLRRKYLKRMTTTIPK